MGKKKEKSIKIKVNKQSDNERSTCPKKIRLDIDNIYNNQTSQKNETQRYIKTEEESNYFNIKENQIKNKSPFTLRQVKPENIHIKLNENYHQFFTRKNDSNQKINKSNNNQNTKTNIEYKENKDPILENLKLLKNDIDQFFTAYSNTISTKQNPNELRQCIIDYCHNFHLLDLNEPNNVLNYQKRKALQKNKTLTYYLDNNNIDSLIIDNNKYTDFNCQLKQSNTPNFHDLNKNNSNNIKEKVYIKPIKGILKSRVNSLVETSLKKNIKLANKSCIINSNEKSKTSKKEYIKDNYTDNKKVVNISNQYKKKKIIRKLKRDDDKLTLDDLKISHNFYKEGLLDITNKKNFSLQNSTISENNRITNKYIKSKDNDIESMLFSSSYDKKKNKIKKYNTYDPNYSYNTVHNTINIIDYLKEEQIKDSNSNIKEKSKKHIEKLNKDDYNHIAYNTDNSNNSNVYNKFKYKGDELKLKNKVIKIDNILSSKNSKNNYKQSFNQVIEIMYERFQLNIIKGQLNIYSTSINKSNEYNNILYKYSNYNNNLSQTNNCVYTYQSNIINKNILRSSKINGFIGDDYIYKADNKKEVISNISDPNKNSYELIPFKPSKNSSSKYNKKKEQYNIDNNSVLNLPFNNQCGKIIISKNTNIDNTIKSNNVNKDINSIENNKEQNQINNNKQIHYIPDENLTLKDNNEIKGNNTLKNDNIKTNNNNNIENNKVIVDKNINEQETRIKVYKENKKDINIKETNTNNEKTDNKIDIYNEIDSNKQNKEKIIILDKLDINGTINNKKAIFFNMLINDISKPSKKNYIDDGSTYINNITKPNKKELSINDIIISKEEKGVLSNIKNNNKLIKKKSLKNIYQKNVKKSKHNNNNIDLSFSEDMNKLYISKEELFNINNCSLRRSNSGKLKVKKYLDISMNKLNCIKTMLFTNKDKYNNTNEGNNEYSHNLKNVIVSQTVVNSNEVSKDITKELNNNISINKPNILESSTNKNTENNVNVIININNHDNNIIQINKEKLPLKNNNSSNIQNKVSIIDQSDESNIEGLNHKNKMKQKIEKIKNIINLTKTKNIEPLDISPIKPNYYQMTDNNIQNIYINDSSIWNNISSSQIKKEPSRTIFEEDVLNKIITNDYIYTHSNNPSIINKDKLILKNNQIDIKKKLSFAQKYNQLKDKLNSERTNNISIKHIPNYSINPTISEKSPFHLKLNKKKLYRLNINNYNNQKAYTTNENIHFNRPLSTELFKKYTLQNIELKSYNKANNIYSKDSNKLLKKNMRLNSNRELYSNNYSISTTKNSSLNQFSINKTLNTDRTIKRNEFKKIPKCKINSSKIMELFNEKDSQYYLRKIKCDLLEFKNKKISINNED